MAIDLDYGALTLLCARRLPVNLNKQRQRTDKLNARREIWLEVNARELSLMLLFSVLP